MTGGRRVRGDLVGDRAAGRLPPAGPLGLLAAIARWTWRLPAAVGLVALATAPPAAAQGPTAASANEDNGLVAEAQEDAFPGASAERPRHAVEVLAVVIVPAAGPVSDTYGTHFGFGGRYLYRPGRWSVGGEVGWRPADGDTAAFGFAARLRVVQVAVVARAHPLRVSSQSPWDFWLGAGVVHQRVDEQVEFPDGTAAASASGTGLLVATGFRRRLGQRWGCLGEIRFSRLSAPEPEPGVDGAELGGLELGAGLWLAF